MKIFLIVLFGFIPALVYSNQGIRGVVKDASGELLIGANVFIEESFIGTSTNLKGEFFLPVRQGTVVLITTFVGFEDARTEVEILGETNVEIILNPSNFLAEEVLVSALRVGNRTPLTFTNVTESEIQSRNLGQDIPFLLNRTPSLVASSDAGAGVGYTGFRIRGTDITRINVTVNGIPMNDPESQGLWWINMPDFAGSVENIQIQRGVGTSTNGAAAFGATVNLQTTSLEEKPFGEIQTSTGSFNTMKNTVKFGSGLINNRFTFDGRLSKIQSDGYIDRAFSDMKSFFLTGSYYSPNTIVTVKAFSGEQITYQAWNGVPSEFLATNRTYNGVGSFTDIYGNRQYYDNETDNYQQDHFQVLLSRQFSRDLYLNTAFHYTRGYGYYEQYKENHRFSNYGLGNLIIGGTSIQRTDLIRRKYLDNDFFGLTYSLNYRPNRFDIIIGGAYNRYYGDHFGTVIWAQHATHVPKNFEWYFNKGVKADFNIFAKVNYKLTNRVNAFFDLQYRNVDYSIEGIHDDLRDISQAHKFNFFNPKFGLHLMLTGTQDLYLSYSQGNREPSRSDFRDANPGVSPRPEKLHNIEFGYRFRGAGFHLQSNLYYMNYRDQLVLTGEINDVGAPITTNVPESYRIGIEIDGAAKLTRWLNLDFHVAISRNRINNFTEHVDNWDYDPGDPNQPLQFSRFIGNTNLAFSPSVVAGGSVTVIPFKNAGINFSGKYVGKQYIDNTSSSNRMLKPYFVNDLNLSYTLDSGVLREVKLILMVNNIFNEKYESNAWIYRYYSGGTEQVIDGFFPQAGRHFLVGVTIGF